MNEWPEVVILVTTWCGPEERGLAEIRLEYTQKTINGLKKHFKYPNYSWHISDNHSGQEYKDRVIAMLGDDRWTLTDLGKAVSFGKSVNVAQQAAFSHADIVAFWLDDVWLDRDLDVKSCVQLLLEDEEIGAIRLKPHQLRTEGYSINRHGRIWWRLHKDSPGGFIFTLAPNIRHKRFFETYSPYDESLFNLDHLEHSLDANFRATPGPGIVCPEEFWSAIQIPWGPECSTWL